MKVLIIKKVDDPSAIILETVDMPVSEGAVQFYGRANYGFHDCVALGKVDDDASFKHFVRGSKELRDWLNEMAPSPIHSNLDEVRKYAIDPVKPMRGDIVTVADFDDLIGMGKPQLVLDHLDGFEFLNAKNYVDGSITSKMTTVLPNATVLLAYTDQHGVTLTQVASVLALRPWIDPAAKSGPRCNGNPVPAAA